MSEDEGKGFCIGEQHSTKSPFPNYFQLWQPSGWVIRVRAEIKMGENLKLRSLSIPFWTSPTQADVVLFSFFFLDIFPEKLDMKRIKQPAFWLWLGWSSVLFVFSPQILTSHPCVLPAWAQHPCLGTGLAGHLLQTRLPAFRNIPHSQIPSSAGEQSAWPCE